MYAADERGVPQGEQVLKAPPRTVPDWEAARVFVEVVRKGSFRGAADSLSQSVNALRRRVDELEHALGVRLLTRHVDGVRLTAEGESVYTAAQRMEAASFGLLQACNPDISGEVRLAVTEGLGTFWIAPRLIEFQRANPNLLINVSCAMRSADVLRLEADVAIQITRPTAPDLRLAKLGRLHLMPFVSKSYVETFGIPSSIADVVNHRLLIQTDDDERWSELYDRLFPGVPPVGFVSMRSNVSSAHYWSIAKGGGIGILPTYMQAVGVQLVPLDLGVHESVDIWLTYHPDAGNIPRVRRLIDWTIEAFSPQKSPWFRDEFIHPNELESAHAGEHVRLLAGASSAVDVNA